MLKYNPVDRISTILEKHSVPGLLPVAPTPLRKQEAVDFLYKQVFLGQKQLHGFHTRSGKLKEHHVAALETIGITEQAGKYYHRGLITVGTKQHPVDVAQTQAHINKQLAVAKLNPEDDLAVAVKSLVKGIELCMRGEVLACNGSSSLLYVVRKEHDSQLSQLGTLLLPSAFLNNLSEPVYFTDTTAKRLGRLIQLLY